jgi:chitinase
MFPITMSAASRVYLFCTIFFLLFPSATPARHVHGRPKHRHHARPAHPHPFKQLAAPTGGAESPSAGDVLLKDIKDLRNSLADLPGDATKFILSIEARLETVESLLSSLLAGTGPPSLSTSPIAPSVVSTTDYLPVPPTSSNSLSISSAIGIETIPFTTVVVTSHTVVAIATTTGKIEPTSASYTFDPAATDNVAVYYGQTSGTAADGLSSLCQDPNVDIVILAFVYDFFSQGGYPSANFGPACTAPNAAQAATAPGLTNCTILAPEIAGCQQMGKKVLLSLGGYIANSSFSSDAQAQQFAETLWNLFGSGTAGDPDLRPFGSTVTVDGFDIDNEDHSTVYWQTFTTALRQHFTTDSSKTYYLSAAPQCPIPDASIPMGVMAMADFVWVQFYNNPSCNLNTTGFASSFAEWSSSLSQSSTVPGKPKIYVGLPAFAGAGSGYVEGVDLSSNLAPIRDSYTTNFGGLMFWDGSQGAANVDGSGRNYLEYAIAALQQES